MTPTPDNRCTLSITVAPTDLPFLDQTLPHLARAFGQSVAHRLVVADFNEVTGTFKKRPVGSIDSLRKLLDRFQADGLIDQVVPVIMTSDLVQNAWRGVFTKPLPFPRDYRGAPIVNYLLCLSQAPTRYVMHVDSDMLIHQRPGVTPFVERAIALLQSNEDLAAVLPMSGPPHPEGVLHQPVWFELDAKGFHRFRSFTSRLFLVDRERLPRLYPLPLDWPQRTSPGRRLNLRRRLRGLSTLPMWEHMMEWAMSDRRLFRADLSDGSCWSLHPVARGDDFVRALPSIIERVEAGRFPAEQAGHYDLMVEAWTKSP